jgi:hypothetical protein
MAAARRSAATELNDARRRQAERQDKDDARDEHGTADQG